MTAYCIDSQRGFSLIEALISIALVAILGLGLAYATSATLSQQRFSTTQSLAVLQMREVLQSGTGGVSMAGKTLAVDRSASRDSVTVTVGSSAKVISNVTTSATLEVRDPELFAGDGRVVLTF